MIRPLIPVVFYTIVIFQLLFAHDLEAKIQLPALVADGMVLQRDAKLAIWGWADASEEIRIKFKGKKYKTTTDAEGRWEISLPALKPGGPYEMEISGNEDQIILRNILIGDVWLCAGQSNMVHYLDLHKERYKKEIAEANFPEIRQFLVPTNPQLTGPSKELAGGEWKAATPENVLRFSVIGYFFARELYDKYQVPIGFINASVGGTPIEAWTSEEGLQMFPDLESMIERNKDTSYVNAENRKAALLRQQIADARQPDQGLAGIVKWSDPSYQPQKWSRINIPGYWEDQGVRDLDGIVWYRKDIQVPASMTGIPAKISMGRIVDADEIYINGTLVGNKTYQYPQRRYDIPANVLIPGKNTITIRVINYGDKGGFVPDKPYYLAAGEDTLDLKGYWQYKVGAVYNDPRIDAGGIHAQNQPAALYNGMVAPYTDFPIKGIVWYQGESNTGNPKAYEKLLPALIWDWRSKWKDQDLPFLYVQLPNFMESNYLPMESNWAFLREAQREALDIPNTAMVVAIDLGEWNDIHPGNKKPIGERLALAAQKVAYDERDMVYSGPSLTSAHVEGSKIILQFDQVGSGLISKDGERLEQFAIAGLNKEFVWANAEIREDKVVVWSNDIKNPAYVRYAWADNPEGANLYNVEGLPASPFEAEVAEVNELWHGKKAAVVLTYDDGLEVHLDNAIPTLDSLGLEGTFYLSAAAKGVQTRIEDWRNAAREGHELGNHTLYHPCDASKSGRSWVTPENDLSKYSTAQIVREIEMTNTFLKALDGKTERTYAYTCGDMATGEGSFVDEIIDQFVAMRGVQSKLNALSSLDLTNLNCYVVDESNADHLISWAEKAKAENALLIVLFHGVGGGHSINISLKKHTDFLRYLKENEEHYWVTTLLEASKHSKKHLEDK